MHAVFARACSVYACCPTELHVLYCMQVPAAIQEAAAQYAWAKSVHERYFARGAGSTVSTLGLAPQLDDTLWAMSMVGGRGVLD